MSKLRVKIEYGIFAGEYSGRGLRRALRAAGYVVTRNAADADVIIAHSAGCFWLPGARAGQLLMLIDPPYWPGKTVRDRARAQHAASRHYSQYGYRFSRWFTHKLSSAFYTVTDLPRSTRIIRHIATFNLEDIIRANDQVLLVRNADDAWLAPDFARLKRLNRRIQTVEIPGSHDDITHHPEVYARLLQSFVKGQK